MKELREKIVFGCGWTTKECKKFFCYKRHLCDICKAKLELLNQVEEINKKWKEDFVKKLKLNLCKRDHRHNLPKELEEKTMGLCGYCPTTMTINIIAKERNYKPEDIKKEMEEDKSCFVKCYNCEEIDKLSGRGK